LLHLSFGFVQKQLYTMFLHNWKLPFWRGHHSLKGHKGMLLCSIFIVKGKWSIFWNS
jgi:hypothetical protein